MPNEGNQAFQLPQNRLIRYNQALTSLGVQHQLTAAEMQQYIDWSLANGGRDIGEWLYNQHRDWIAGTPAEQAMRNRWVQSEYDRNASFFNAHGMDLAQASQLIGAYEQWQQSGSWQQYVDAAGRPVNPSSLSIPEWFGTIRQGLLPAGWHVAAQTPGGRTPQDIRGAAATQIGQGGATAAQVAANRAKWEADLADPAKSQQDKDWAQFLLNMGSPNYRSPQQRERLPRRPRRGGEGSPPAGGGGSSSPTPAPMPTGPGTRIY